MAQSHGSRFALRTSLARWTPILAVAAACSLAPASASAACAVAPLSAAQHAAGARELHHYLDLRRRMFAHDLMGYRDGPRLPAPTKREQDEISFDRAERHQFGLNPSTLLIRRLLRDPKANGEYGFPTATIEAESFIFEDNRFSLQPSVFRYARTCLAATYGGVYFDRHRDGQTLDVVVTRNRRTALRALRKRSPYPSRIRVHIGRWTLAHLREVQDAIDADWDLLATLGVDINTSGIDERANVVTVGVTKPTADQLATLRQRYGRAVRLDEEGPVQLLR